MYQEFVQQHKAELDNLATAIRVLSMDAVLRANSGHIGLPLGGAEMAVFLYFAVMNYNPKKPNWLDRDRFVLSAGHGSMLQYSALHLAGFDLSIEDIKNFRQWGSKTPGHPEYGHTEGVECTTGPLGQGVAHAVGLALAERMLEARFGPIFDHRTYVIAGDGCLMEGVSGEASSLAGHLKLNRLVVFYDANQITIDGTTDISFTENVGKRYEAYGWNVFYADGNSFESLAKVYDKVHSLTQLPNGQTGPTLMVCKGIPGKGSPKWEGKHKIHGNPMTSEDVLNAKKHLGVEDTTSFVVPQTSLDAARFLMPYRIQKHRDWETLLLKEKQRWKDSEPVRAELWKALFERKIPVHFSEEHLSGLLNKMATRVAGGKALVELARQDPSLVGGSADLAGSNLTALSHSTYVTPKNFSGRNIHFGVREHAMAAICNGITLHGGLRAFCATFAVFSDYMRPAMRLAALMKIPTLFILTHDSYAVGEDGPTHQPIEHVASLRAMPNLQVFRPADALETFAAWETAVTCTERPTALFLTRQDVPNLCSAENVYGLYRFIKDNGMHKGAYCLKDFGEAAHSLRIVLVASGSEVGMSLQAAIELESEIQTLKNGNKIKLTVRVVSAPAPQLLSSNREELDLLVPQNCTLFAIEAGVSQGFGAIVGRNGHLISMDRFGASAPAAELAKQFGFTKENLVSLVLGKMDCLYLPRSSAK